MFGAFLRIGQVQSNCSTFLARRSLVAVDVYHDLHILDEQRTWIALQNATILIQSSPLKCERISCYYVSRSWVWHLLNTCISLWSNYHVTPRQHLNQVQDYDTVTNCNFSYKTDFACLRFLGLSIWHTHRTHMRMYVISRSGRYNSTTQPSKHSTSRSHTERE